jgi:hypothetical protein
MMKNSVVRTRIDAPTKNEIRVIGDFVLIERLELSKRDFQHVMKMIHGSSICFTKTIMRLPLVQNHPCSTRYPPENLETIDISPFLSRPYFSFFYCCIILVM